ncbi:hypothetical protein GCM10025868_35290 [Angustibacter aerolatus]|uniref:Bacterial type II secretion system protein E domain-containing protein n=1 Tax=Angustibacter aerolatus TaxID=1162965 RepID=A0ABQ6JMC4_9ACTN|nr:hypothetical protein GCM10025868_35290 [Angustibacter aerolatus]
MDQSLVRRVREEVADVLAQQRREDAAAALPPMTAEDERQFARAVIGRVLETVAREELTAGRSPLLPEDEEDIAEGVHAALFGVGRLQPLLDDPEVENIDINGCDRVFVSYADGREQMVAPIADTDDELVELVQVLGSYSGLTSRPFDSANPQARHPPARRQPHVGGDGRGVAAVDLDPPRAARQGVPRRAWWATAR